jgi:hypothetical protein
VASDKEPDMQAIHAPHMACQYAGMLDSTHANGIQKFIPFPLVKPMQPNRPGFGSGRR